MATNNFLKKQKGLLQILMPLNTLVLSHWEIAIKVNLGKLRLDIAFEDLRKQVTLNGFELLPFTFEHTVELTNLDLHHRDPFDRIIICQALVEKLTLISKDGNFGKYSRLQLLW
jgi:PIN domain nuclease of toxin-antitoxin system